MVEHFRSDPQTSPLVYDLAVNDGHERVRLAAVSALVRYFCADLQTVSLLCNRAINDESPKPDDKKKTDEYYVRETAINALARYWPNHPNTLPLLRERAENDHTPWLRERAKELVEQLSNK
ncbi:MAG: HEAT repeat domain-containing protein [Anaerolineae bacterium]|nr:HEAT repeat domain-containing protein [Anaerolineae bacterium]MCI0697933.1 HEAT repeat domain-containing protein [candidate division KSB1 bacterium]